MRDPTTNNEEIAKVAEKQAAEAKQEQPRRQILIDHATGQPRPYLPAWGTQFPGYDLVYEEDYQKALEDMQPKEPEGPAETLAQLGEVRPGATPDVRLEHQGKVDQARVELDQARMAEDGKDPRAIKAEEDAKQLAKDAKPTLEDAAKDPRTIEIEKAKAEDDRRSRERQAEQPADERVARIERVAMTAPQIRALINAKPEDQSGPRPRPEGAADRDDFKHVEPDEDDDDDGAPDRPRRPGRPRKHR